MAVRLGNLHNKESALQRQRVHGVDTLPLQTTLRDILMENKLRVGVAGAGIGRSHISCFSGAAGAV